MFKFDWVDSKTFKILDPLITHIIEQTQVNPTAGFLTIDVNWKNGLNPADLVHIEATLLHLEKNGIIECPFLEAKKTRKGTYLYSIALTTEFDDWHTAYQTHKNNQSVSGAPTSTFIKTHPDAKWEDLTIKFINGHDVSIEYNGRTVKRSDYKEMGFEDSKTHRPNKQWEFLRLLSKTKGTITWASGPLGGKGTKSAIKSAFGNEYDEDDAAGDNDDNNQNFAYFKSPDTRKKQKGLLSARLKSLFRIKDAPFWPYTKEGGYSIRIKLIP
jgi:hypothetical protein